MAEFSAVPVIPYDSGLNPNSLVVSYSGTSLNGVVYGPYKIGSNKTLRISVGPSSLLYARFGTFGTTASATGLDIYFPGNTNAYPPELINTGKNDTVSFLFYGINFSVVVVQ